MRYIKKFEKNKWSTNIKNPTDIDIADEYIKDESNFPEFENIRNILINLSDWCYSNSNYDDPIQYRIQIFRIDRDRPFSILWDLANMEISFVTEQIYYKSCIIEVFKPRSVSNANLSLGKEKDSEKYNSLKDEINLAQKRLSNYGFTILDKHDPMSNIITFYVIDKNDPIRMDEILKK